MPKDLNGKMLTINMTVLIALTFSTRAPEVCSLNIDLLVKIPTHSTFHFSKITKPTRQGKHRPLVELTQFSHKNLCVCHHKNVYLKRTMACRKNEG